LRSRIGAIAALFSSKPLTLAWFYSPELQKIVSRKLCEGSFDLIFVYCSSMAQYVEGASHIPRVIDFVDVDSEKWQQYAGLASFPLNLLYRLESARLRSYERLIAERYQRCFFVSAKEAADFRQLVHGGAKVTAIPNGVDLERFSPSGGSYKPGTLVFTGAMDYFANADAVLFFVKDILPLVRQSVPGCTLLVVGRNPPASIRALPAKYPGVTVTGAVESVVDYVTASAVFVAPMRIARGVQNKILEAMAMGVPVVTTPLGHEGIEALAGRDIIVVEQPALFARQVVKLLTDPELRNTMSLSGRRGVEEHYDWAKQLGTLEQELELAKAGICSVA
ncbi:MAG: hypothetical protein CVU24_18640, partial [Betaproteobacteria bacterium HGW-Betaproteobacteria-18]